MFDSPLSERRREPRFITFVTFARCKRSRHSQFRAMLSVELGRDSNSGAWQARVTHVDRPVTGGGTDMLHEEQPSWPHRNPQDGPEGLLGL